MVTGRTWESLNLTPQTGRGCPVPQQERGAVRSKLPGASTEWPGQGGAGKAVGRALGPDTDTLTLCPLKGGVCLPTPASGQTL